MKLHHAVRLLLALVFGLPLVQAIFLWVAGLLRAMGDEPAAAVIANINTAAGVLWLVVLVGLVVALAMQSLERTRRDE
jgi:hypothetical protein